MRFRNFSLFAFVKHFLSFRKLILVFFQVVDRNVLHFQILVPSAHDRIHIVFCLCHLIHFSVVPHGDKGAHFKVRFVLFVRIKQRIVGIGLGISVGIFHFPRRLVPSLNLTMVQMFPSSSVVVSPISSVIVSTFFAPIFANNPTGTVRCSSSTSISYFSSSSSAPGIRRITVASSEDEPAPITVTTFARFRKDDYRV